MIHTTFSQWSVVLLSIYTSEPNTLQWNCQLPLRKRNTWMSSILVSDGYPSSFIWKLAKTTRVTAVLHYIEGVFEVFCCCLQHQGIWTIFKSDTTLRSHLVWNKKVPFTRSHVNVAKCISAKQGDQCIKDKGTWQRHTVFSYCGFREC